MAVMLGTTVEVIEKTIVIQIPRNRIKLMSNELIPDKSSITDGKKMLFVDQFKPSEVETILEQSQQNVVNKVGNDKKFYDTATENLKGQLEGFVLRLNYFDKVQFEEV
jgi:hypothetical protein